MELKLFNLKSHKVHLSVSVNLKFIRAKSIFLYYLLITYILEFYFNRMSLIIFKHIETDLDQINQFYDWSDCNIDWTKSIDLSTLNNILVIKKNSRTYLAIV